MYINLTDNISLTSNHNLMRIFGFILISIFLHSGIIYYLELESNPFDVVPSQKEPTLNIKLVPTPIPTEPQPQKTITKTINPPPVNKTKSTKLAAPDKKKINAQQLITNSLNYLNSQRITEIETTSIKPFGIPDTDPRTKSATAISNQQDIESFRLANGNSMIKMTSLLGYTACAEIQNADPLDEWSVSLWYITKCY